MVMGATTRLSVSDFLLIVMLLSLPRKKKKKLTLNYVYPVTLDSLVCFSENALLCCYS